MPWMLRDIRPSTKKAVPRNVATPEFSAILTIKATASVSSRKGAPSSIDPTLPTAHKHPFTLSMVSWSSEGHEA